MVVGLGADFWIGLCCVGVLFFGFCVLSGFSESVMRMCCDVVVFLVRSAGMFKGRVPKGVGNWHTGMGWEKEDWSRGSL